MKQNIKSFYFLFYLLIPSSLIAQVPDNDSIKIDYKKIYAYALDGKIKPALEILPRELTKMIPGKDTAFIAAFNSRFAFEKDKSNFFPEGDSRLNTLLDIYRNYWRSSLLNNAKNYDTALFFNLVGFIQGAWPPSKEMDLKAGPASLATLLNKYLKEYIESMGMHTTGFGRTGALLDLLVWKKEQDTVYHLSLTGDPVAVHIIFMDDFISLGWEDYATLGRYYPGGWATREALYCVRKTYDTKSENFAISYLSHEGRHFADYRIFPKLSSPDLEYRAKLTELSLAKETLYKTIEFFIINSNYESSNAHSIANYCVIRDLSKKMFHKDYEKDLNKWKQAPVKKIHKKSKKLLQKNTRELKDKGPDVEYFIKEKRG